MSDVVLGKFVPFGNKSIPLLLKATNTHHLSTYKSTPVIKELSKSLYEDDWLTGADSDQEATDMFLKARDIMLRVEMSLTKLSSNDKGFTGKAFQTLGTAQPEADLAPTKIIVLSFYVQVV